MDADKLAIDVLLKGITEEQQASLLESIKDSVTQAKTIQKQRIGENVNVVIQALRKMEADLRGEYSDVADKLSERITSIKDGQDGHNGSDGRAGKDGRAGRDGVAGKKGEDGLPGRDGIDGVDGVSVTDASIDFDGSLVITLSNGRVINVGEVVSQELANNIKVISTMSTNGAVGIQDEGTSVSTGVKNINFVGATVTATASGDDVTVNVSAGTGTVTSVAATAGTGISVTGSPITTTGTLNITNTAPDQVVSLTGAGSTTITGTYPSFTISSSGGSGTVTSVAVSGGTTGLTTSGGPITTTGTITLAGTLAVANGGTGVTTSTGTTNVVLSNSPTLVSPALGTPASGVVTNLTGTASININGTVGATTPATGAFTTVSATGKISTSVTGSSFESIGATALTRYLRVGNTGGDAYFGVNSSTGGAFGTGGTAYDAGILGTTGVGVFVGSAQVSRFSTTGLAVTGALSASGSLNSVGNLVVGSTASYSNIAVRILSALSGATGQIGIDNRPTIGSDATVSATIFLSAPSTAAAAFTVPNLYHNVVSNVSLGVGSAVTNQYGLFVNDLTSATYNYGIRLAVTTGANKYNIYASGTAQNVFAGNVRIGSTVDPTVALDVTGAALISTTLGVTGVSTFAAGTVALPSITTTGDTNTGIYFPAADTIAFTEGGAEAMRIDSSGRLLIAFSTSNAAFAGKLQYEDTNTSASLVRYSTSAGGAPSLYLARSKGAAVGTNTIVASGDTLGIIAFSGANGTGYSDAAYIQGFVDGTPGASADMPGRLVFSTSSDGSATPTERMRIDSSGNLGIGTSSPATFGKFVTQTSTSATTPIIAITDNVSSPQLNHYITDSGSTVRNLNQIGFSAGSTNSANYQGFITFSTMASAGGTISERMRINASGNVGIGTASPNASAILDAQSTTKGVRMPNMTTTQKNAIATPAAGLMVYDTTLAKLCVYTTAWETITSL